VNNADANHCAGSKALIANFRRAENVSRVTNTANYLAAFVPSEHFQTSL
jgi:hypothetical protein